MLWRVIEDEVVPTCEELGLGQIVWSPIAQGVLTGKYQPGQDAPAGSRATDTKGGANMITRWMRDDVLTRVQQLQPIADELGLSMAAARRGLGAAERQRRRPRSSARPARSRSPRTSRPPGVKIPADALKRIDEVLGDVVTRDPAQVAKSTPTARAL